MRKNKIPQRAQKVAKKVVMESYLCLAEISLKIQMNKLSNL